MKKIITALATVLLSSGFVSAEPVRQYTVSNTDVNRIICPGSVSDVIFSDEKGLISKVVGSEVFVKFPVIISIDQETQEKQVSYSNQEAEMFLVCGGTTYNILLKPAKIASQTIEIEAKVQETNEFKGKDTEEVLGALIGFAIEGNLPKSFRTENKNISYNLDRNGIPLDVIYRKVSKGSGYAVKEFHIYSGMEITLSPAELVGFPDVGDPLAVSLTAEKFTGWTRGFVVEALK